MRKILLSSLVLWLSSPVFAADASAPVKQIMSITEKNWAEQGDEWKYIFDEDLLGKLFSKAFVAQYRQAAKNPAYETENGEPGDPFGYDVITSSQDGCPLKDLSVEPQAEKDGVTPVVVKFKLWTCLDMAEKDVVNIVRFDVVTEGGRAVIGDIHRIYEEGEDSLMGEMANITKGE